MYPHAFVQPTASGKMACTRILAEQRGKMAWFEHLLCLHVRHDICGKGIKASAPVSGGYAERLSGALWHSLWLTQPERTATSQCKYSLKRAHKLAKYLLVAVKAARARRAMHVVKHAECPGHGAMREFRVSRCSGIAHNPRK